MNNETTENTNIEKISMKIATLKGPTGMGLVQLMEKDELGEATLDYEFSVLGSPDDLVGKIVSGEVDAAAIPTNFGGGIVSKDAGKHSYSGGKYFGCSICCGKRRHHSFRSLKGKTMEAAERVRLRTLIFDIFWKKTDWIPKRM